MGSENPVGTSRKDKLPLVAALSALALNMVGMADVTAGDWRVRTTDGGTMPARDFRSGPGVEEWSNNEGSRISYSYVSSPYSRAESPSYALTYFPNDESFFVHVLGEPVGPTRRRAASDLAGRLGITLKDLCRLVAKVNAPEYENYATGRGRSIGFPGCPGSVRFPGDPQF